jgi:hypothetical protein
MEELSVFFMCSAGVAHGFKDGNGFVACTIKDQRKWRGGWFSRLLKMMEEEARWLVLVMELVGFFFWWGGGRGGGVLYDLRGVSRFV